MASQAANAYAFAITRIKLIRDTANDPRLRPVPRDRARILLHASLAGYVASWESYLERVVREYFQVTADPLQPQFNAAHTLLRALADPSIEKFNTPNADNARNLLLQYTGFDPFPVWLWPERRMNAVQVRERLAEILKVRHSFAHGFAMPTYPWNTSSNGQTRLTWSVLDDTERFFQNLVRRTDDGMNKHVRVIYGRQLY